VPLVENHGECEDERLVDVRDDIDMVRVLSFHDARDAAHLLADLRNIFPAAAPGDGHRSFVVAAVDDVVWVDGGIALHEHVDKDPHLPNLRLVDGDEEPVAPARAPAPDRLPPAPACADLLDGDGTMQNALEGVRRW
jgi:hypothetical protein